jgi:hypothetical protein
VDWVFAAQERAHFQAIVKAMKKTAIFVFLTPFFAEDSAVVVKADLAYDYSAF